MKRVFTLFAMLAVIIVGCTKEINTGTIKLSLTDAPIVTDEITGVFITFNDIQYHISDSEWRSFEEFEGPVTYNLLELTRGETALLGDMKMEAATYTQLRFIIDAPENGNGSPTNPGCYLTFTDGSEKPLFVPSGAQSGYKGTGMFTVPVNGTVDVTADFDVQKSVVRAGLTERYILKPTIRLIVDNQAGQIHGAVTSRPENNDIAIYLYNQGEYEEIEAANPEAEQARFPNAVTSDIVDDTGSYHLAFVAQGTYELVVARFNDDNFEEVIGVAGDVIVESNKTTVKNIDISIFYDR